MDRLFVIGDLQRRSHDEIANSSHALIIQLLPGVARPVVIFVVSGKEVQHRDFFIIERQMIAPADVVSEVLRTSADAIGGLRQSQRFLETEWSEVVDAWQLTSWEAYRDVARLGRKTRLPEAQRKALWEVFERTRAGLAAAGWQAGAQVAAPNPQQFSVR